MPFFADIDAQGIFAGEFLKLALTVAAQNPIQRKLWRRWYSAMTRATTPGRCRRRRRRCLRSGSARRADLSPRDRRNRRRRWRWRICRRRPSRRSAAGFSRSSRPSRRRGVSNIPDLGLCGNRPCTSDCARCRCASPGRRSCLSTWAATGPSSFSVRSTFTRLVLMHAAV